MFYLLVALAVLCVLYMGMKAMGYSFTQAWKAGIKWVKDIWANWQD